MNVARTLRLRVIAGAAIAAVLAALAVPLTAASASATGAPPTVSVVSPAPGASGVASPTSLRVTPTDSDDSSLSVEFHAQARVPGAPNSSAPFTFLVIPDTQNYASSATRSPIMAQQTQWIADHRSDLNLAFVAHLGDIVGVDTVDTQWQRASSYLATLDAAGIPNSVLPGNHDMDLTTGAAPLYQQYFPVSRYANASWNSTTASYGGYLGENQFGPDPVDRENMDNYALFTAGGMDFLLLNLEFNPPDYAIDWAKRVLAAYPSRRAILATHSYVDFSGALTPQVNRADGGNSGQQLFTKLVQPSCSIFLVVNGHFHNGDQSEARRTDTNSCGGTVNSILSDYQDRANGGDGYLRYYTFDPAANQIRAYTYSTYLGQYETDADSQFTIPYDMTAQPAYPLAGTATVASGGLAAVVAPTFAPGTTVDWYALVSDGTTTTRSQTWSYTTAPAGAAPLAADGFGRTITAGWGNAETGGPWTLVGGNTRFTIADGTGNHVIEAGRTVSSALGTVASTSTDLQTTMSLDRLSGEVYATVSGRLIGAADYGARIKVLSTGAVQLHLERSATLLVGGTVAGLTAAPGQKLRIRLQVDGTAPTTLRAKVWANGAPEPAAWQFTTTDNTAGLQAAGGIRLQSYVSAAVTGGPMTVRWDDFAVSAIGSGSTNQPPHASFTSSTSDLTASVDSSGSTDPDGTIVGRSWTFGDGGTATGITASHSFAAPGTYPVTLTVTDNQGVAASSTAQISVSAPPPANQPPNAVFTSSISNLTATVDSSDSSDPDGSIVSRTWTFGDGATASGTIASHSYGSPGSYQVTLTVTDDQGATSDSIAPVTVSAAPVNQPPIAAFTSSVANLAVSFDSTGSSDPDGTVVGRSWSFGDGATATGITTSHSYAVAGTYPVTLTVTDDKGAPTSLTTPVTVTTPTGPVVLASDAFGRTLANGWGSADAGGTWTAGGVLSRYSVAGGTGVLQVPSGATVTATLNAVSSTSTDLRVSMSQDTAQNNTVYSTISGRVVGSSDYGAQVKVYSSGSTQLWIERSGTAVVGGVIPGLVTAPGTKLNVRVQVQGTSPTVIRVKLWAAGSSEPASWQYTLSDSTAGLQSAGGIRLSTYLSSAATTGPVTARWDDLQATAIG